MVSVRLADKPFKGAPSSSSKFLEQLNTKGYYSFYPSEQWTPNVNLYETDLAYLVCVDLAGVEKDKIDIHVDGVRLTLRGSRAVPSCADGASPPPAEPHSTRVRLHLMEIDHGAFARDVELPQDVHSDQITARYIDGLLWIELPRRR